MIGSPRVHLRVADSTNERARALALEGAPHGTIVTADEQTAGRGRQGRVWTAAPRSALLMSLVVRDFTPMLPLAAAVAVCEAVAPIEAAIKWPNDVWVNGLKVAGILVEGRPQEGWAVLGIGLNVTTREFPDELREIATSLALAGSEATTEEVLAALLPALERRLEDDAADVLAAWRERDALLGRRVRWHEGEGIAAGVAENGSLLVDTETGRVTLGAGEIHLLP
jgi:BirA family biotin operon repressor/biotin-[acetyl-CoA-carboxylase] ligase